MSTSPTQKHGKYNRISVNEIGQVTQLNLCQCTPTQIRSFHITWITFWFCFFVWFCTTNIYTKISSDLTDLTLSEHQLAGTLSVTSTIIFRLIISYICIKFGSRIAYLIILISTFLSLIILSFITSVIGYIIIHVFVGIAGASFVVTQYHTTRMFSGQVVGAAQAMTAGFGNFGGGCANFIMPLILYNTNIPWRILLVILAVILLLLCILYYFGTADVPPASKKESLIDMHQTDESIPNKQVGGVFTDAAYDYRTWVLFMCYAGCFGVEISFYLVAAEYFQQEYGLNEVMSGLFVMIWSLVNLFARPIGGNLADKYDPLTRVKILFIVLFLEAIFIIIFGIIGHLNMWGAFVVAILFSCCTQAAEGVVFSIVPFIQPQSIGHVIGIVGSGGNFGAAFFIFIIFMPWKYGSNLDEQYAWICLGTVIMIISLSALLIKFSDKVMHQFGQGTKATYNLDTVQTKFTLPTVPNKTQMELEENKIEQC